MATRYQFQDDSGETRLGGFLVPEPGGPLLNATGSLTAAQIKSLNSSPVTVVSGVADHAIVPYFGSYVYTFGTIAYADGGNICFAASVLNDALLTFTASGGGGGLTGPASAIGASAAGSNDPLSSWNGLALVIGCLDADFTAGDGTIKYSVFYEIVPTT